MTYFLGRNPGGKFDFGSSSFFASGAVAVGVGALAALLGGLVTGSLGTSTVPGAAIASPSVTTTPVIGSISAGPLPQSTTAAPAPVSYAAPPPPPQASPPLSSPPVTGTPIAEAALTAGTVAAEITLRLEHKLSTVLTYVSVSRGRYVELLSLATASPPPTSTLRAVVRSAGSRL